MYLQSGRIIYKKCFLKSKIQRSIDIQFTKNKYFEENEKHNFHWSKTN